MSVDPPASESDPTSSARRYRALVLYENGRILKTVEFSAWGEGAALAIAKGMVNEHAIELWDGLRFLDRFEPPRV
ncbi:hypothetical protein OCOJLMKI_0322 [Methylobacterium iners]|uniref:Uncharacterized protein n=1 Tax=Methylobacterium iners TaxID=418707 RepID=A0ABQ4RU59_9HYPH|nr:hypothetical protein OCOJLMKI_0322 [Methylobacterium iners]